MDVLKPYRVAFKRLVISFIFTFVVADLYPHPLLATGLIISTISSIQSANAAEPDIFAID
ncbi:hypothetical protein N836_01385 [Leptolyngbya sp. Heron Island J]|uniref:hypothetical protein n=1 Tax=Leptolyngbya sp. Heron Island J TaxID=1385935 RepID=UPI0003B963F8|nr:hypothetical protein [Leptolyngbya sp. Heron Island J]ESA33943.1 hypothetical protein N836_01385 [Leptolyngbya sp. Heron Island J]